MDFPNFHSSALYDTSVRKQRVANARETQDFINLVNTEYIPAINNKHHAIVEYADKLLVNPNEDENSNEYKNFVDMLLPYEMACNMAELRLRKEISKYKSSDAELYNLLSRSIGIFRVMRIAYSHLPTSYSYNENNHSFYLSIGLAWEKKWPLRYLLTMYLPELKYCEEYNSMVVDNLANGNILVSSRMDMATYSFD